MLIDLIKKNRKIHSRTLNLTTHFHREDRVLVHGELKDTRHIPIINIIGEQKGPGTIHHIHVVLEIAPYPLRILDAQAVMETVPMDQCRTTLDTIDLLKGMEVKAGFTAKVKKQLGGTKGCTHLCNLVCAMAQEIVHGWLTLDRKKKEATPANIEDIRAKGFLINSCRMWREGGPRLRELEESLKKNQQSEK